MLYYPLAISDIENLFEDKRFFITSAFPSAFPSSIAFSRALFKSSS